MQYGHFSVEEWKMLDEAKQWLAQYKSQLLFVQLFDYSISTIKKIIHKFSKLGYGTFFYDTAKPEDESSDKAWAVFTENSKELFQIANTEDIILICTAQLSGMTIGQRYLNVGCLAKAKAIKEVASQIVMIRNLWEDEYTQENHDIRPYNMFRDEDTGRYTNTKQYFETDKNKQYAVIFVDKNRFGRDGFQLLYQKQLDFNTWHELGFCTSKQY
jgi:hypothetical protein